MRRRPLQPNQAIVVHVGKNRRDRATFCSFHARSFRSPGARIQVFEEKLVHAVVGRVGFQQNFAKAGGCRASASHIRSLRE